jgi:propanol-preferring alcohol dehydrogenase
VIAVDISEEKLATAKALGADEVVVADKNAGAVIQALGGAQGCVNFAPVGATWPLMLAACNPRATIVLTAVPADQLAFYTYELVERGLKVVGSSASNRQEMNELLALAARGNVKGMINTMCFDKINDALACLMEGRVEGRTVLDLR